MNILNLTSPIPLSVNHYIKPRPFIKNGKAIVTLYEAVEAKRYKKDFVKYIREQVLQQKFVHIPNKAQHFYVDCVFYFDRIDKDANNYFKLLLDAITDSQCVWLDDNTACERVQAIYYDSKNPRIEITIHPVDYIGVFKNQEQLDKFEDNCIRCTRYKERKCSILCRAIEGRIQDEVHDYICKKHRLKGE